MQMYKDGIKMAEAAAKMTDTKMSYEVLGSAWPGHFNKPMAEAMQQNIQTVGLPKWSEDDQVLARGVQKELGQKTEGLNDTLTGLKAPETAGSSMGAGSDDIADISWNVPTIVLRFPSNIPGLPGHNWANAISMATPIAHKGVTAGAKAEALTLLDLFVKPELVSNAKLYYTSEQTKETKYIPLISKTDKPAIFLNKKIMDEFRPQMRKFYYDPSKYDSYLQQLGIKYPTVRGESTVKQ
jgi:aminobenzoyl-glutamate utilization protein B